MNAVDRHVSRKLRERRIQLSLSQRHIATALGVTYQQAHKYEAGVNRLSVSSLCVLSKLLTIPVSWLFEGLTDHPSIAELTRREEMGLELGRNFAMIKDSKQQEALCHLARTLLQAELSEKR